jgi:GH24 family phage-related lysozyme (muramidase)
MDLPRLNAALATDEGARSAPYKDTQNLWSVGEGTCLETNPLTGPQWKYLLDNSLISLNLTTDGASYLNDEKIAADQARWAQHPWWAQLSDARQNALLEMSFQLGYGAVTSWPEFMAALNAPGGPDIAAAVAAARDTHWDQMQTHTRAERVLALLAAGSWS